MEVRNNLSVYRYYIYIFAISMRLTRIVNVLYLVNNVNINLIQFAFLQSLFSASQFIMEVPAGIIGDRIKKKMTLTIGMSMSVISLMMICSKTLFNIDLGLIELSLAFILEGFARAFLSGADEALFFEDLREHGFKAQYDRIIGKSRLIISISLGIATLFGTVMYSFISFLPYISQIVATMIAMLVVLSVHEGHVENEKKKTIVKMIKDVIEVRKNSNILFLMIFSCFVSGVVNTLFGIMPDYISEIGFSSSQTGAIFLALSLISGFVASQAYRLSKCTYIKLVLISLSCMILGTGLICLGVNKIIIFLGLTFWYIIIDILDPVLMKVFNFYATDDIRATFLSAISFMGSAMMMILYPIVGVGVQWFGMDSVIVTICCICVAFLLTSCVVFSKVAKREKYEIN